MLLISRSKILMFDWWTVVSIFFDLQLHLLAPNIFSCFSNHLGALFFFLLFLWLPSSVLQWHHEGGNFFSEYDRSNWLLSWITSWKYIKRFQQWRLLILLCNLETSVFQLVQLFPRTHTSHFRTRSALVTN